MIMLLRTLPSIFQSYASGGILTASIRRLNLLEYQSKKLMADSGIAVQRFRIAESLGDAKKIAQEFKVSEFVIKAQILAGGRGKGVFSNGFKGGVQLTRDPRAVPTIVGSMLGHRLVTKQTPKNGVMVRKVLIGESLDIARETYLAIVMDRESGGPLIIGSREGGVDIEEVAARNPTAIHKEPVDIVLGLLPEQANRLAEKLGFVVGSKLHNQAVDQIRRLYELFCRVDCTQVEINPLVETPDGRVVCFDAKFNFDDSAAFRQSEIFSQEDTTESDPREVEAARHNLNYISMDGSIGCLVNGAGLAMATMDIVKLHGGSPANFLDVGGGVTEDQVQQAFKILTADPSVRCVLVNIFGGIVNCATIARGITNACRHVHLKVPLVVRLEGTNAEAARQIMADSGLRIATAGDLDEAARKAVASLD